MQMLVSANVSTSSLLQCRTRVERSFCFVLRSSSLPEIDLSGAAHEWEPHHAVLLLYSTVSLHIGYQSIVCWWLPSCPVTVGLDYLVHFFRKPLNIRLSFDPFELCSDIASARDCCKSLFRQTLGRLRPLQRRTQTERPTHSVLRVFLRRKLNWKIAITSCSY